MSNSFSTPFICLDCLHKDIISTTNSCPHCQSPRILQHPELHELMIAHIDCDAFYASIEKRDNPDLANHPVIVGHEERGVVAAACYTARVYGVRSAMPIFMAKKKCPHAIIIKPRMNTYQQVSHEIRNLMLSLTPQIEAISIDEAFLDLTGTETLHQRSPVESLILLSNTIRSEIGLSVSIGLADNKSMAKVASEMDKPCGFYIIGKKEAAAKLAPMHVSVLHGAGKKLVQKLAGIGIHTCNDFASADPQLIRHHLGEGAASLQLRAEGIDHRPVISSSPSKSISAERTFKNDIADAETLNAWLLNLAGEISTRLKKSHLAGKRITLKLKSREHKSISRSITLSDPTQLSDKIFSHGRVLLEREIQPQRFWRLLGIGVDMLTDETDADPPDLADPDLEQRQKLEKVMDNLRDKHGTKSIFKGRNLNIQD